MKHLEPRPAEAQAVKIQTPQARPVSRFRLMLYALILVGGMGYGLTHWWNPWPRDNVTEQERAELVSRFTRVRSIAVAPITAGDVEAVLDAMRLDPSSRQALKHTLDGNAGSPSGTALAEIVLWDFAAQDGDVVRVSSAGYAVEVALVKAPATIAVPIDASRSIGVTGVRDGGGGITLGIRSGADSISLPVLAEGQELRLPVSF